MNLLGIDCTEFPLSISATNGTDTSLRVGSNWQKSGEQIIAFIEETLSELNLKPSELMGIALSSGPGSFTALRIGIATAKGLSFANETPLVLVPTFEALAQSTFEHISREKLPKVETLITLSYAKADEFFVGISVNHSPIEYQYWSLLELIHEVSSRESVAIVGRNLSRWKKNMENMNVIEASFFNAQSLFPMAKAKVASEDFSSLETAEPMYLKNFEVKKRL